MSKLLKLTLAFASMASLPYVANSQEAELTQDELNNPLFILRRGERRNPLIVLQTDEEGNTSAEPIFQGIVDPSSIDEEPTDENDVQSARRRDGAQAGGDESAFDFPGRIRRAESQTPILDDINTSTPSSKANLRVGGVEPGVPRAPEEDPYAPIGFRLSTWQGNASAEQRVGYSTNLGRSSGGSDGFFSQTDLAIGLQSDWSRHQAQINANASYQRNFDDSSEGIPSAGINGLLRLDLMGSTALTMTAGYNYSTEAVTSTTIGANVAERPGFHNFTGLLEFSSNAQRLNSLLRGSVNRNVYEDGKLTTGATLDQSDRDNILYEFTGRVGYEVSPAINPFIQATIGLRDFDEAVDRNGQNRDSRLYSAEIGAEIDLGEKLSGELSIGYRIEDFEDGAIEDIDGVTLNASLDWSPWRATAIALSASTNFNGSTASGTGGTIVHSLAASIERQVNHRLTLDLRTGMDITQESTGGIDRVLVSTGAGFEYALNRNLALTGDLDFEMQFSDDSANEYEAGTIQAGIRWQK